MTRVWRYELRHSPALLALPLLILLHAALAWRRLKPGTDVYLDATSAVVAGVLLSGPLVAGVAAWVASRESRRGISYLRVASPRSNLAQPVMELSVIVAVATMAYVVVAAVVLGKIAFFATWGRPAWLWLIVGWLALQMYVVAGYVAGRFVPRPWVPPTVMLCCYLAAAWNLAQYGHWWYFLSGATVEDVSVFRHLNNKLLAGQAVWYLGISGVALSLAAIILGSAKRLALSTLALAVAVSASGATLVSGQQNRLQTSLTTFRYTCSGTMPQVCVHPAFSKGLPALAVAFTQLHQKVAGTPAEVARVEQLDTDPRMHPSPGAGRFALENLAAGYTQAALGDFLNVYRIGPIACLGQDSQAIKSGAAELASLVRMWLLGQGTQPGAWRNPSQQAAWTWFATVDEASRRLWLKQHYDKVTNCALTTADFGSRP